MNKKKQKNKKVKFLSLSVCGFKSIADKQTIEIRPLTILAGANSSGKSSIMQPLLLMKQTLEAQYDPGVFLLDGPNVHFSLGDQLLWKGPDEHRTTEFTVELEFDKILVRMKYVKAEKEIDIAEMAYKFGDNEEQLFTKGMTHDEIKEKIPDLFDSIYEEFGKLEELNFEVVRKRCFREIHIHSSGEFSFAIYTFSPGSFLVDLLLNLIHLPGLRGNPERTCKKIALGKYFPGTFQNYVASVIDHWKEDSPDKLELLGKNLQKLGLTWKIDSRDIDDTQIGLYVGRLPVGSMKKGSGDMVSIADVGLGVSQTLPVVLALMVAEPGQIVYIEQPELHLHPGAQVALAQIISEASKRGVRVVIETHSQYLLLGVQTLVAEGKLNHNLVKLHWFTRRKNGSTKVSSVDLDKSGAYGDWPEDFSNVELKLEERYINAFEKSLEME
ncbi:MAG: AAA family ATPase [Candidatus Eremiobacteraeota bacterium]|nr:AAA family ATPase [Candidatus Eremiobacteraeota bacterium]